MNEVRCPNCGAKLAEALLEGVLFIACRQCTKRANASKIVVRIDTRTTASIK